MFLGFPDLDPLGRDCNNACKIKLLHKVLPKNQVFETEDNEPAGKS